ncbi:DUF371 domain-containing protein [Halorubellus sp. JP-L1]|uniref:DUF371 domain-containing protein n=1 Tax=Halorubellus sp. JP-L1 TaxID=2715753 RepID=UPI001408B572|nr:DUF371 domain-containing protein [Halorubellus sp. JP-L1]NHN42452.1 DUF371 domain-containing protein [Halorubellus sp. JP-L1]
MTADERAATEDEAAETRREVVHATGHENVTAEHASTFEVTTDDWLTPAGDCILAVDADRAPADFSEDFRTALQDVDATVRVTLEVDDASVTFEGRGHPDLALTDDRSMVGRTSTHVDDRTIMHAADGAAESVDRDVVDALAAGADVRVVLEVEPAT